MTPFQLYTLLKLDEVRHILGCTFVPLAVLSAFGLIVSFLIQAVEGKESKDGKQARGIVKVCAAVFIVSFVGALATTLLPTTRQMAAIIVVPKVCNAALADSALQRIPSQITTLASEWLEELRPEIKVKP